MTTIPAETFLRAQNYHNPLDDLRLCGNCRRCEGVSENKCGMRKNPYTGEKLSQPKHARPTHCIACGEPITQPEKSIRYYCKACWHEIRLVRARAHYDKIKPKKDLHETKCKTHGCQNMVPQVSKYGNRLFCDECKETKYQQANRDRTNRNRKKRAAK
jgi:hypothetical protein